MRVEEVDLTEWERALPNRGISPFHTSAALEVLDDYASATLRPFVGYNGERAVALLPLFVRDEPFARFVLSPPPGFEIRGIGPVLMPASPKRSKREKLNNEFTNAIIDAVDARAWSTLLLISCEAEFRDPRPFEWAGFDVETRYTYQLDLESTTRDELLNSFSRSLRREITDDAASDITIRRAGLAGIDDVYEATKERYVQQGKGFDPSLAFVSDLIEALDGRASVYVAEDQDGRFCSGLVALYSNETAYFWMGGTRQSHVDVNVNSLLHWRVIEDIYEDPRLDSITAYDFLSANKSNIVRFKRKFDGQLVPFYRIESNGVPMALAKRAFRLKRDLLS